ncbi:hypothetical protein HKD37_04G009983 [Glycine soja]
MLTILLSTSVLSTSVNVTSWKFLLGIFENDPKGKVGPFCSTQMETCGIVCNKIIEKEKTLYLKPKSCSLSSLSKTENFRQLSLSLTQPSSSFLPSTIVAQQSFNLWCPFLLQIAKGGHFRNREVRVYEWDFETSGLGGLLSLLIFFVLLECCFAWMLWKLGRIDGDPVLRETRIWAMWAYVSSDGGGQQGMSGTWRYVAGVRRPWGRQVGRALGSQQIKGTKTTKQGGLWWLASCEFYVIYGLWPLIVMAAQLIHDRVEMECLEGAWETLEGKTRCRFRGTIRFMTTSLVHPDEPARTLQRTVEWILPTPTPYRLVEPVQVIEVTSSEEDPEEDPEELPPEPAVDALDFLEGDEDPLPEVDSPEEVMSASEADSTEDSGPGEMAISGGSSS